MNTQDIRAYMFQAKLKEVKAEVDEWWPEANLILRELSAKEIMDISKGFANTTVMQDDQTKVGIRMIIKSLRQEETKEPIFKLTDEDTIMEVFPLASINALITQITKLNGLDQMAKEEAKKKLEQTVTPNTSSSSLDAYIVP